MQSYYGDNEGELKGDGIGYYCVNEFIDRLIEETKSKLSKVQNKLLKDLKAESLKKIKAMEDDIRILQNRCKSLEKEQDLFNKHRTHIRERMLRVEKLVGAKKT